MAKSRGRSPRSDNEFSKIQKITNENKKLKTQLSRLRKQFDRTDAGWCPGCLDKYEQDAGEPMPAKIDNMGREKKDRTCFKCREGVLVMTKYQKLDTFWYFRRCTHCDHRTRGKKLTPEVEE